MTILLEALDLGGIQLQQLLFLSVTINCRCKITKFYHHNEQWHKRVSSHKILFRINIGWVRCINESYALSNGLISSRDLLSCLGLPWPDSCCPVSASSGTNSVTERQARAGFYFLERNPKCSVLFIFCFSSFFDRGCKRCCRRLIHRPFIL